MECGITVKVVIWAQVSPLSGMGCGINIWISIIFNNKKTWRNNVVHRSCKSENRQCSNEVEKEKERKGNQWSSVNRKTKYWATRILLKNRRWTQLLRYDKQFLFY
jgi:ACT domain-containing protein